MTLSARMTLGKTKMDTSGGEAKSDRSSWLRFIVSMMVLVGVTLFGGVFLFAAARDILGSEAWRQLAYEHFAAAIGLPVAVLGALFVVLFLEVKSGRAEFEAWGLKFRGASGEVVLFVVVFLAFAIAIKVLW
jgi:hypothetical protein